MKCLITSIVNLTCNASSKKEAEKCLRPDINRLKSLCEAFGLSFKLLEAGYQPGTGNQFGVDYLFSFKVYREGNFGNVIKITNSIQFFCDLNGFEMADEKLELINDEE